METTGDHKAPEKSLGLSEKVAIINALMAEDRQEVRNQQESLLRLSYLLVPAFAAIAAFYEGNKSLKWALFTGQVLLGVLYIVVFLVTAWKWLPDARACQRIREEFYENGQALLFERHFEPLRPIERKDYAKRMSDRYIWFLFAMTLTAAIVAVLFIVFL